MNTVLGVATLAGGLAATLAGLVWLGQRVRRRGVGGDVLGPWEEIWHPAVPQSRIEIQAQEERVIPMPPADPNMWMTAVL